MDIESAQMTDTDYGLILFTQQCCHLIDYSSESLFLEHEK